MFSCPSFSFSFRLEASSGGVRRNIRHSSQCCFSPAHVNNNIQCFHQSRNQQYYNKAVRYNVTKTVHQNQICSFCSLHATLLADTFLQGRNHQNYTVYCEIIFSTEELHFKLHFKDIRKANTLMFVQFDKCYHMQRNVNTVMLRSCRKDRIYELNTD